MAQEIINRIKSETTDRRIDWKLETLPVVGKPSDLDTRPAPEGTAIARSKESASIARMFGNTEEDLKKHAGEAA